MNMPKVCVHSEVIGQNKVEKIIGQLAPVAQRIRAAGFYPACRRFDSCRGHKRAVNISTNQPKDVQMSTLISIGTCQ